MTVISKGSMTNCPSPHNYTILLKRLLRNALVEGRFEEANRIFTFLAQIPSSHSRDPLFLFKTELELLWTSENFNAKALGFFRVSEKREIPTAAEILEDATNYYVRHGKVEEAYENLNGYLSGAVYNSSPVLHGYAVWLTTMLIRGKKSLDSIKSFCRRIESHFEDYLKVVEPDHIDMTFVRAFIEALKSAGRLNHAKDLIFSLLEKKKYNMALRLELLCLLSATTTNDHGRDYGGDHDDHEIMIRECILGIFDLSASTGCPIGPAGAYIDGLIRGKLLNPSTDKEDFFEYLKLRAIYCCIELQKLSCDNYDSYKSCWLDLEDCHIQFASAGLLKGWEEVCEKFPFIAAGLKRELELDYKEERQVENSTDEDNYDTSKDDTNDHKRKKDKRDDQGQIDKIIRLNRRRAKLDMAQLTMPLYDQLEEENTEQKT